MFALLTFYDINDVNLRKKRIARFLGQESTRKNKDRAYTTEEIRKMLHHADIRSKALVLLLASSGMRIGAVPDLRIRHLKKIPEPYNIYSITVYENTREEYTAICTPECAAAIDAYIDYRQKSGERITENAPLICESFDRLIKDGGIKHTRKKPEILSSRGVGAIISNLLIRSGILEIITFPELQVLGKHSVGSEHKDVRRAHGLRKYLLTALTEAEVDPQYRKMLLGQDLGLDEAYLKPSEQQLLQKYVKVIDSITINNEHRLEQKVVQLTQKQDDIELIKAEQQRKDLELREQMQQQQQQYQRMIEEFQVRDRKEKEELRREVLGYLKATRILVDLPENEEAATTTTAMKKSNKAYYLQPEDKETKETLKKAQTRAVEQLRKDTLARHSHSLRSIKNRIQQHQQP